MSMRHNLIERDFRNSIFVFPLSAWPTDIEWCLDDDYARIIRECEVVMHRPDQEPGIRLMCSDLLLRSIGADTSVTPDEFYAPRDSLPININNRNGGIEVLPNRTFDKRWRQR